MPESVVRYVVTHMRGTQRTLAHAQRGSETYDTPEKAQAWIDAAMKNNGEARLREIYGFPLEVRPVECWPGHFDPKTCWFDT